MTVPLSPTSPRRDAARRFGDELRRAMARRGVGQRRIAAAAGVASSAVSAWRAGNNLPTLTSAERLAESLDWPQLASIVHEARSGRCQLCGKAFLNEGGKPKRYCSATCGAAAAAGRAKALQSQQEALKLLRGEVLRVGPVRKQSIGKALTLLSESRLGVGLERSLSEHVSAVEAFCTACSGHYCPDATCPLRPVSQLPLAADTRQVQPATRAPGRWGHPGAREEHAEHMRQRWQDPEAASRLRRGLERAHEVREQDPEAWRRAISEGRRKVV